MVTDDGLFFPFTADIEKIKEAFDNAPFPGLYDLNIEDEPQNLPVDITVVSDLPIEVIQDYFEAKVGVRPFNEKELDKMPASYWEELHKSVAQ